MTPRKKKAKKAIPRISREEARVKKERLAMQAKCREAILNGIVWLDLTFGREEWLGRMDMSNFEFDDVNVCVAGHVFSDAYIDDNHDEDSGFEVLTEFFNRVNADGTVFRLGFDTKEGGEAYQYMQDVWAKTIISMQKSWQRKSSNN